MPSPPTPSPPPPNSPTPSPPPLKAPGRPFDRPGAAPLPAEDAAPRIPPRVRRELLIYGVALLFGLFAVPPLIWMAGNRVLGPYTHGQNLHAGPLALLEDFLTGLLHGSAVFWVVALGPAALVLLVRGFIALLRAQSRAERTEPPPTPARRAR
ncbi:MAG: hypothetical protein JO184_18470 [Gammaproteobacteria bacterium]|nr:hypothetical protein [Gammaproteobacteria bacterium]MBV8403701.1 hypothetical protein [Gammaproteobacteria bacterium]